MFIDSPKCNLFIEDFEENNAVHYVMNVRQFIGLPLSILDFAAWYSFVKYACRKKRIESLEDAGIEVRQERCGKEPNCRKRRVC